MTNLPDKAPRSNLLLYQTEDGGTRIQVRLENETVWLTQKMMAELFQKDVRTINEHIRTIYDEGELKPEGTIRKFRIVQPEGTRQVSRAVDFYNLDVIISVGYRVKSHRGSEYEKFRKQMLEEPTPVERHFIEAIREVKKLERSKPASAKKQKDSGAKRSKGI